MSEMTLDLTTGNPTTAQLFQALSFNGTPWVRFLVNGLRPYIGEGILQSVSRESGSGNSFILEIRTPYSTVHQYVRAS